MSPYRRLSVEEERLFWKFCILFTNFDVRMKATTEFDGHFVINLKPKKKQIDTIKSLLIEVGIGIPNIMYDGTFVFRGKDISQFENLWEKQLTNFSVEYEE